MPIIKKIKEKYTQVYDILWHTDITTLTVSKQILVRSTQIMVLVLRDVTRGLLPLRAMGLVYTTLLSIVPLLAVSFSVLKGFGVHNQLQPFLLNIFEPLGNQGVEITQNIIQFVENMKVGVLGALGLVLLLYTAISMIQKIESAFNYTWRVTTHRPFIQRFSNYISLTLVGPLLIFSAIALTASVASSTIIQNILTVPVIGVLVEFGGRLLPYFIIITAFSFFYIFVPNTKVRVGPALIGAVVAGLLWESAGWLFASFIVGSTKYTAVYSAMAALIIFMVWLYASWVILLVGTNIAYYVQNPDQCTLHKRATILSSRQKEQLALLCLALIGKHYCKNVDAWTTESLSKYLSVPEDVLHVLITTLVNGNYIINSADTPAKLYPARAAEKILLKDVVTLVRAENESSLDITFPKNSSVDQLCEEMEAAIETAIANKTLKDISDVNPKVVLTNQKASG